MQKLKGMIILKYTESFKNSNKKKNNAGFYIVAASCILILGGASWFALSNIEKNAPKTNQENQEYKNPSSSYNEEVPKKEEITDEVNDTVSKEPYREIPKTPEKPTFMMPAEGKILKSFSDKNLQFSKTFSDMRLHDGIDIACKNGTSVSAVCDGTVLGIDETLNFGKTVTVEHTGNIIVKYSTLKDLKIKEGDHVKMGDIIGLSSTVPCECKDEEHIHISVIKSDKFIDPIEAFGLK